VEAFSSLWERRKARWGGGRNATEWPATPFAAFAAPTDDGAPTDEAAPGR